MSMQPRSKKVSGLCVAVFLGILVLLPVSALMIYNDMAKPWRFFMGKLKDHGTHLVYIPNGLVEGKTYPLVFALSPSADAMGMISAWSVVADKHHWIVAASKEFRNGQEFNATLRQIKIELNDVEKKYSIDSSRVIVTGISGGGMGAHAFSKVFPGLVSAVVINTGMMADLFMTTDYPKGKLAVFLASPTDFRYTEMQRDRKFLEDHQWRQSGLNFQGVTRWHLLSFMTKLRSGLKKISIDQAQILIWNNGETEAPQTRDAPDALRVGLGCASARARVS